MLVVRILLNRQTNGTQTPPTLNNLSDSKSTKQANYNITNYYASLRFYSRNLSLNPFHPNLFNTI